MNNKKLIKGIIKKDEKALEYLIDEYGWVVKTVVYKYLYNFKNLQEECINDIFLRIWNNIKYYDSEQSSLKNWIASISKYKAIDYLRKYAKELEDENIDYITGISDKEDNYKEVIEEGVSEELEKLIEPLNEDDKRIFRKLFYEEKTVEEISKEENLKKNTIYSKVSRGKKKIKDSIEEREAE